MSAISFSLSGGEKNDSPEGIKLLNFTPYFEENRFLLMDRAYQRDLMRQSAFNLCYKEIVGTLGIMIKKCIKNGMKLKDTFGVLNVSEEFSLATINWILGTPVLFCLL